MIPKHQFSDRVFLEISSTVVENEVEQINFEHPINNNYRPCKSKQRSGRLRAPKPEPGRGVSGKHLQENIEPIFFFFTGLLYDF